MYKCTVIFFKYLLFNLIIMQEINIICQIYINKY